MNSQDRFSYHGASELLRQFPVVRFRENRGDDVCVGQNLRMLETHSSPGLRSDGFVHQGEHCLLWLERQLKRQTTQKSE